MTQNKINIKYLVYALLLYFPTLANVRSEFYLLAIGAIVLFEKPSIIAEFKEFKSAPFQKKYLVSVWLVILIFSGSLINKMVNGIDIVCMRDYYSSFYLFPLLILVSKYFGKVEVFKFLIALTVIEVIVGCIEYGIGTRSILVDLGDLNVIRDRSLLYNSRVNGLSIGSTIFAYKVLVAILLLEFSNIKQRMGWVIRAILLLGMIISFSRSVVTVVLIFWIVRAIYGIVKARKNRNVFKTVPFQFNVLMVILIVVFNSGIRYQLSRGGHEAETIFSDVEQGDVALDCSLIHTIEFQKAQSDPKLQGWGEKIMMRTEGVQSSGRKLIWVNYINFIENNLLFGMGSDKVMLRSWQPKTGSYKVIHAHNSILMLLSTNGLLIFGLYIIFYLFKFKSRNYLPIAVIFIFSMINYGVFWGFSYLDVIFIVMLTTKFKDVYDYQGEN